MRSGKVLILESDRDRRLSWTRTLSREGYHVTDASSVEEAVKVANRRAHELLIISMKEPEFLDAILAKFSPGLGVLIISAEEQVNRIVECSGVGIHSFLIQPFSLAKLKTTVAQTIEGAHLVKECFQDKILMNLEHTTRLLLSEADEDKLFKLVADISAARTNADYVSLLIKDNTTGEFVVKARIGDQKPNWEKVCQRVTETGKPILLDETTRNPSHLHRLVAEAGISTILCAPLIAKGELIGAINNIKVAKRAPFTPADLLFISILGWWSGIALANARLLKRCESQSSHLGKLLQEIPLVQEHERRRVASDIHDSVSYWITSALYRVRASSVLISESRFSELDFELTQIKDILRISITELHRVIDNLRPAPLEEQGLAPALHQVMKALNGDGIRCHINIDRTMPKLAPVEEITIYRITQEALTNAIKHSKATDVSLRIKSHGNIISVEISDNGQGFNVNQVMNSKIPLKHLGLLGMKERAELLCGNLSINSKPGEGTLICYTFSVSSQLPM